MQIIESGIRRARTAIRDIARGYSDQELHLAQRIIAGTYDIGDEDRQRWRTNRIAHKTSTAFIAASPILESVLPIAYIHRLPEIVYEVNQLPIEEVDRGIVCDAQDLLERANTSGQIFP